MTKLLTCAELRREFLSFFANRGHRLVTSSPVIPHDDPTLLFNNAGMNQFKDFFLGKLEPPYAAATTSQKCVRVGGKHNDLENVGHTRRHLTFFEMLGNFSFGDYFKEKAIRLAWELSTEVFGFEPERIWPSVYEEDDEAFALWKELVPEKRIVRFGKSENFWEMGESGPCGPCSELLFDRGPTYGKALHPHEDPSGERFLEFWNLVFMQYNRGLDGEMAPLPSPSIDTGAGLERVAMLKIGSDTVFETDILRSLIAKVEELSGKKYLRGEPLAPAFQVIADHIRTLSFAIADGAQPSNEGRGYVLRKVLRRAVRYAKQLGLERPFLAELVPVLLETMGEHYSELVTAKERIGELLTLEEENFLRTLRRGGALLGQVIERSKEAAQISGDDAFKLKDTYGLPFEEVTLLAKDSGLKVDSERYQMLEEEAREKSRAAHKKTAQIATSSAFEELEPSTFVGYTQTRATSVITALFIGDNKVSEIPAGTTALVITEATPFYAQMGGQVGDSGEICSSDGRFSVTNTLSPYTGIIAHEGTLDSGRLKIGDSVDLHIDGKRRREIRCHHSATHLLHWALEKVLGPHVRQAGSLVDANRLRFDFNHHKALTPDEILTVERLVNAEIRKGALVNTEVRSFEDVQGNSSIKQFFADKYDGEVRVVSIGPTKELCGGTHADSTGEIGLFKIVRESSVGSGVRRVEALCSKACEEFVESLQRRITSIASLAGAPEAKIEVALETLKNERAALKEELKQAAAQALASKAASLQQSAQQIGALKVICALVDAAPKELKGLIDQLNADVAIVACKDTSHCALAIKTTGKLSAKELLKPALAIIDGKGGGSDLFATGAGSKPEKLEEALGYIQHAL